ncbi:uncharacterized protein [Glycine max]|uniref:uncharacterized protein n=1 Tax=Glycine max TaxID=3847 RepID=UPI00071927DE|nr:uncharacterized protein LOC106796435 [Glycine max]|eukprot:XP_014624196.1 uncharacterized protein LOC106796435 [Glycine max]
MAAISGSIPANLPILMGKNYENWKIQISVVMRFQGVWEFVEEGYIPVGERAIDEQKVVGREKEKTDCKALFILHQSVDAANFEKIAMAQTSKEAWDILEKSHDGATKTKKIKLQTLRRQYELLQMEKNESVVEYITKVQTAVNSMKGYGEKIIVQSVVEKVLRTMPPKFDHIVVAIEESKNLEELSLEELQGSLESHEQRMNERINEKKSEKALQAQSNPKKHSDRWKKEKTEWKSNKWRGNHNSDKDHKKGRGSNSQNSSNRKKFDKRSIQCFNYQKFGHFADECYRKPNNKREPKGNDAKLAQEENEDIEQYLDIGCSTHMTGRRKWFLNLDQSVKSQVKFANDRTLSAEGIGKVLSKQRMEVSLASLIDLIQLNSREMVLGLPQIKPPSETESLGGNRYFISFIDELTKKVWVYLIRRKSDVFEVLGKFKNMAEKQSGSLIKILRTNVVVNMFLQNFKNFVIRKA